MILKEGKQYKIKRFKVRPGSWNSAGDMDHLMGHIVTIEEVSNSHVYIQGEEWVFSESDFEPIGDWDE